MLAGCERGSDAVVASKCSASDASGDENGMEDEKGMKMGQNYLLLRSRAGE